MPKIVYKSLKDQTETEVAVADGWTVMEGAIQNDVDGILAECGGGCACATCHVYVEESYLDKIAPLSDVEADMLECVASDRKNNSRLACQITVTEALEGLVIEIPEAQV